MKILHYVHLHFILLFVITAFLCTLVLIQITRNKKKPKLLTQEKYQSTMPGKMSEIKNSDSTIFNIWPYVSQLKTTKIISHKIKERDLIHKVYRDSTEEYEHILLSTEKENNFVVIVADKKKKKIMGYYPTQQGEYNLVA